MVDKIRLNKVASLGRVVLMSTPLHRTTAFERQHNDISNHKYKMIKVMGDDFDIEGHINKILCHVRANPLVSLDDVILSCERSALKGEPFCYQDCYCGVSAPDYWPHLIKKLTQKRKCR